jgi:hypothetical protein
MKPFNIYGYIIYDNGNSTKIIARYIGFGTFSSLLHHISRNEQAGDDFCTLRSCVYVLQV